MEDATGLEIDRNYNFFQRNLAGFLREHGGQFALLRAEAVVGFFDKPGEAYRTGLERFPDHLFSIQEVTDKPIDLGVFSVGLA